MKGNLAGTMIVALGLVLSGAAPVFALSPGIHVLDTSCVIDADRTVWCWGENYNGLLGTGEQPGRAPAFATAACPEMDGYARSHPPDMYIDTSQIPLQVRRREGPLEGIQQMSIDQKGACAVDGSGHLWCWGCVTPYAELAKTDNGRRALSGIVQVSLNRPGSCALNTAGRVSCWGEPSALINPERPEGRNVTPVLTLDGKRLEGITQISAGNGAVCARSRAGNAWCWGGWGSVIGRDSSKESPWRAGKVVGENGVGHLENVQRVAVGAGHACAIDDGGSVWCWGERSYFMDDERAKADSAPQFAPVKLQPVQANPETLTVGGDICLTVTKNRRLWCWRNGRSVDEGAAGIGQIGRNSYGGLLLIGRGGLQDGQKPLDFGDGLPAPVWKLPD